MSELAALAGSERYEACADDVAGNGVRGPVS